MDITPQLREEIVKIVDERIRKVYAARKQLKLLREAILANTKAINQLAEAQAKTEERLNQLALRVDQLAEAQAKTEERLNQLAAAVERLVESVDKLTKEHDRLSNEFKRWRDAYGFSLEDIARVVVPGWLLRHEGVEVELERKFFIVEGKPVEVNLYGETIRNGRKIVVVGEVKSRIYDDDVIRFIKNLKELRKILGKVEVIPLMFGFLIHPTAQEKAEKEKIRLIASYQR